MYDSEEPGKELLKVQRDDDDEEKRFENSLHELKGLRSQLHGAAEYCVAAFLNAEEKTAVVEDTKEYICKAVVTVIDHLGSISANLESLLSRSDTISDTELRMNSMRQRLVTCQQYTNTLSLSKFCLNAESPTYHPQYILPRNPEAARLRVEEEEEEVPLFLYTFDCKPSLVQDLTVGDNAEEGDKHSAVLPVLRDEIPGLPRPKLRFQFQEARKLKRGLLNWKSVQNKDFVSFVRRGRKTSS